MQKIASSLASAGFEVLLLGRNKSNSNPLTNQKYNQHRLNCFFEKGKLFYIEFNIRLFFYLLFNSFHIVNAIDLDTIIPCFVVSKLKQKPCVYDAHEYFTEVPEVIDRPLTKWIWEGIEGAIVPRLKYCYTVSTSIANLFEKKYKTPFSTIRNVPFLVNETNSNKFINKEDRFILYQGALNVGRGLECLIESMQYIPCKLKLVGEGDLSAHLRFLVQQYQIAEKVEFMGFIEPNKLKNITQQAYIGINVSENLGLSYYYSLNNKFFDYIHAGLPSVTNNFPEYNQINNEFEVAVISELTTQNLVKSINLLLNDDELYQRLVVNCENAKLKYNWELEEQQLIKIYQAID
jgi:glycosyltransferase involved in cell wall biosynthesis